MKTDRMVIIPALFVSGGGESVFFENFRRLADP